MYFLCIFLHFVLKNFACVPKRCLEKLLFQRKQNINNPPPKKKQAKKNVASPKFIKRNEDNFV